MLRFLPLHTLHVTCITSCHTLKRTSRHTPEPYSRQKPNGKCMGALRCHKPLYEYSIKKIPGNFKKIWDLGLSNMVAHSTPAFSFVRNGCPWYSWRRKYGPTYDPSKQFFSTQRIYFWHFLPRIPRAPIPHETKHGSRMTPILISPNPRFFFEISWYFLNTIFV